MSRRLPRVVFAGLFGAVALAFVVAGLGSETGRVGGPAALAAALLALTVAVAVRELRAQPPEPSPNTHGAAGLLWALALPPAIYLLGCLAALAAFTVAFLRFRGRRSWTFAAVCGALAAAPVYLLAEALLRPELLTGVLFEGLAAGSAR